MNQPHKPVIGITCGDLNGIGIEIIIKVFSDNRVLEQCTPVIFASNKVINFYRKTLPEFNFNWQNVRDLSHLNAKQMNIYNCWEEDVMITPATDYFVVYNYKLAKTQVLLYDISGKLIKNMQSKDLTTRVDVSKLANGVYILTIKGADSKNIRTEKIIIAK